MVVCAWDYGACGRKETLYLIDSKAKMAIKTPEWTETRRRVYDLKDKSRRKKKIHVPSVPSRFIVMHPRHVNPYWACHCPRNGVASHRKEFSLNNFN